MASGQGPTILGAFLFWVFFVSDTSLRQKQLFLWSPDCDLFLVEAGRMSEVRFEFSALL